MEYRASVGFISVGIEKNRPYKFIVFGRRKGSSKLNKSIHRCFVSLVKLNEI